MGISINLSGAQFGGTGLRTGRLRVTGDEMSGGFRVDLGALVQAAVGVSGTISDLQNNKVSDIGGADASYGDDDLAATVSDFCSRWESGGQTLANEAQEVANRLYLSAANYAKAEKTIIADLQGNLQSRTGTDPAASQW